MEDVTNRLFVKRDDGQFERVFTPNHIAERIGLSLDAVLSYLRRGRLKGYKIMKVFWLIPEREAEEFIKTYKLVQSWREKDVREV